MRLNNRIVCLDGASVSVQANQYAYCTPRDDSGPYWEVEAGFPSVTPPRSWLVYAENPENLLGTVYGYMPTAMIEEFISTHGGMIEGELPEFLSGK